LVFLPDFKTEFSNLKRPLKEYYKNNLKIPKSSTISLYTREFLPNVPKGPKGEPL
jgi:hypothetical protein